MTNAGQASSPDCPAIYQITVRGYLDKNRADWFDGMSIVPHVRTEHMSITWLTGEVADQAALLGLLRKLHDLGLPLLSVQCMQPDR